MRKNLILKAFVVFTCGTLFARSLAIVESSVQTGGHRYKMTDCNLILDTLTDWDRHTEISKGVNAQKTHDIGGKFDLMGNGALMLQKTDTSKAFWKVNHFKKTGKWKSRWIVLPAGQSIKTVQTDIIIYGLKQDMSKGWVKFEGNPLICGHGSKHATAQSMQLPETLSATPNDQALVRGRGKWEGKWLLLFNIGSWAKKGWAMAVADRLETLKQGINPFKLAKPYPLFEGTNGENAPNDWINVNGTWYAPDESKHGGPHMWTSLDMLKWSNHGQIKKINGHDPGMCFDGERFYLFNEFSRGIKVCSSKTPLGEWKPQGIAFETGDHCGDADVSFFNNRWHMTYDDNPHGHYKIGYASTYPSSFPKGWELKRKIFGPHNPEQGQIWDNDTAKGNNFGTGDADIALEGATLYMTYERPVGIAYKELDVLDGSNQTVEVMLEIDEDEDGKPDHTSSWHNLSTGSNSWNPELTPASSRTKSFRISYRLGSQNAEQTPLITQCSVIVQP